MTSIAHASDVLNRQAAKRIEFLEEYLRSEDVTTAAIGAGWIPLAGSDLDAGANDMAVSGGRG